MAILLIKVGFSPDDCGVDLAMVSACHVTEEQFEDLRSVDPEKFFDWDDEEGEFHYGALEQFKDQRLDITHVALLNTYTGGNIVARLSEPKPLSEAVGFLNY